MNRVRRALISVHDKTGVVDFAKGLAALGVEILSTGGTANLLRGSGVAVVDVAQVTGFPEMLDGRVKTLHPKVHGGILARRERPEHVAALEAHGIGPIDLVAVTLYPFEQTVARAGVTLEEAIENIDVGGPSMIRGAAKNHDSVIVITDTGQYMPVLDELRRSQGTVAAETRYRLAFEAFRRTAQYDAAIATYLREPGAASDRYQSRRGALSRAAHHRGLARPGPPLRGEPAPGRGVLPAGGRELGPRGSRPIARPGARLQQSARLVRGPGPPPRVRGSGGRRDQAHEPVRGCPRPERERGGAARQGL